MRTPTLTNRSFKLTVVLVTLLVGFMACFEADYAKADSRGIRQGVFDALEQERGFGPYSIEVSARMGHVVLSGSVASAQARSRVEDIARALGGVRSISNNLQIDPTLSAGMASSTGEAESSTIAERVRESVLAQKTEGSFELNVRVLDDEVTLAGTVGTSKDRDLIERSARAVPGVGKVRNELVLRSQPNDESVTTAVLQALKADTAVLVEGLTISTQNGVVTIRGDRPNHRDRDRILAIALGVPGVRNISSELR